MTSGGIEGVVEVALPISKQTRERMVAWCRALRTIDARGIRGDVVECGVYRGASIVCARLLSPDRHCWLYDTFAGMTEPGPEDVSRKGTAAMDKYRSKEGWMVVPVPDVAHEINRVGAYDHSKITFVEGDVCRTLTAEDADIPEQIAALRLDTDWYASTKVELEVLFPRLQPGGVLLVDDYGYWQGAKKAVDEYSFGGEQLNWIAVDDTAVMAFKGG